MIHDPFDNIERIKIKSLSQDEQERLWSVIKARMPSTPTLSPFASFRAHFDFMSRKTVATAAVFLIVFGTVRASNSARPGNLLFLVDRSVERIESIIDPSSRADHARERVQEFTRALGDTQTADTDDDSGAAMMMQKTTNAPEADTPSMEAMMATDAVQENTAMRALSPEMQKVIDTTRRELHAIEAQATLNGDAATLAEIQETIAEFELYVANL